MRDKLWQARVALCALALAAAGAAAAAAQEVSFKDPTGDDNGPGKYTYPTDTVYKPGSFDLTGFNLKARGDKVDVEVSVAASLEDPWKMGTGFSVQMVFIFIQTQPKPANGFTQGLPGLNIQFGPDDAWDRCIILSPQAASRVKSEVDQKAAKMKDAIVIPGRVKGSGHTISATVDRKALGDSDPTTWGYQVVMQSNEGFPAATDLLTRKVNEYEGQHRFGGGTDGDCDPHVIDILAPDGKGDPAEVDRQHKMLQYECNPDNTPKKLATLVMVHYKK
jgi:carbohydrate-binding DOMON domain-containing protein